MSVGDTGPSAIVGFPWEVLEYLAWLRQQPSSRDASPSYLFDDPKLRFVVAEADVIVADAGLRVEVEGDRLRLSSPKAPVGILLEGVRSSERQPVRELLESCDGQRCLGELRLTDPLGGRSLDTLIAQAFGSFLFAPLAVSASERAVSGIEITRFPGSPYEIARPYWKNMAAVRARLPELDSALDDDERFLAQLCQLHVIALMGEDLQTYYQPASPISSGRAAPGRLMRTATEIIDTPRGCLLVQGPRVNAAFVGGARYHELLYRRLKEPEAGLARHFVGPDGLNWGRIVHAKAPSDSAFGDWFCPPRPISSEHVRFLRTMLGSARDAALRSDLRTCLTSLAEFHQAFVRLHPFYCGNQCLAMNIVNRTLGQMLGAGIPHLMLDHLALRLSASAYATVFQRCVAAYVDPQPSAAARYLRLASNRTRTFAFTRRLADTSSIDEAEASLLEDESTARLLMLID